MAVLASLARFISFCTGVLVGLLQKTIPSLSLLFTWIIFGLLQESYVDDLALALDPSPLSKLFCFIRIIIAFLKAAEFFILDLTCSFG